VIRYAPPQIREVRFAEVVRMAGSAAGSTSAVNDARPQLLHEQEEDHAAIQEANANVPVNTGRLEWQQWRKKHAAAIRRAVGGTGA